MLEPDSALQLILAEVAPGPTELLPLGECVGLVLSADIHAGSDLPLFDNSAMDGYAVVAADLAEASAERPVVLPLRSSVFAGDDSNESPLASGACALITTGAPLPPGADAVVPRELIQVLHPADESAGAGPRNENSNKPDPTTKIEFRAAPRAGAHVRRRGEDVRAGTVVMKSGTRIASGQIALLASFGYDRAPVYRPPRVGIVPTGNELVQPAGAGENQLKPGQIYESNGRMLEALVAEDGLRARRLLPPRDEREELRATLHEALDGADVVLISGGVSVGDRDYVREELAGLGCREIFWRVKIKPGKPFYFGLLNEGERRVLVFGLPGNPASGFVVFEEFVRPALRKLIGRSDIQKPLVRARLVGETKRSPDRRSYARATLARGDDYLTVAPFGFQGSHGLVALAGSNALAILPPGAEPLPAGEAVEVRVLRGAEFLLE